MSGLDMVPRSWKVAWSLHVLKFEPVPRSEFTMASLATRVLCWHAA